MKIEIKMPSLRPEMESGVLCQWNAQPGDVVEAGDVLFEIETAKVVTQIEANARLKRKYDALKDAGKHTNVAKVAVVSELVRWMWAMGLQVQREQAAA